MSARQILRIGLLDAIPRKRNLEGEKTDPQKIVAMFESIEAPFDYTVYQATEGDLPSSLSDCDAYLVTGGPCSVYDKYAWIRELEQFVRRAYEGGSPLIGICFGHQLIAQSLGGQVRRADQGWLVGLHDIAVQTEKFWMRGSASSLSLYFINEDQVVAMPPNAELVAGSNVCPHAMFAVEGRLLSIQAHPEQPHASMQAFTHALLDDNQADAELVGRALATMEGRQPDSTLFAQWIVGFVESACGARNAS